MKVIRDGDGCVSWAQFEFDFTAYPARPLVSIPLYVSRPDCADFSLADVVAAAENPNPDTDGDGVPDDQDAFPNSNLDPTVVIGGCDSSVGNQLLADGSTFNDLIGQAATNANNHGEFVSAVAALANQWKQDGLISGRDKGKITSCAS